MVPSMCGRCFLRRHAERRPATWIARLWRWHTGWCPGWKAYQRSLLERTLDDAPST